MVNVRSLVIKVLILACMGLVMGNDIECEIDDDKLYIDLDDRALDPGSFAPEPAGPF